MTAKIIATVEPDNAPPRVRLDLTGFGAESEVDVVRVEAGGTFPVRSLTDAHLAGGARKGFDYEACFRRSVRYTATTPGGVTATSEAVSVECWVAWLIHPGVPSRSMLLRSYRRGDRDYETGRGIQYPIGRSDAVTTNDGTRRGAKFPLTVQTYTYEEQERLQALLDDSSVLLMQLAQPENSRVVYMWVDVDTLSEHDMTGTGFEDEPERVYTLPCTRAAPPDGASQAQRTLGTIKQQWPTLGAIKSSYRNLGDVAANAVKD